MFTLFHERSKLDMIPNITSFHRKCWRNCFGKFQLETIWHPGERTRRNL